MTDEEKKLERQQEKEEQREKRRQERQKIASLHGKKRLQCGRRSDAGGLFLLYRRAEET